MGWRWFSRRSAGAKTGIQPQSRRARSLLSIRGRRYLATAPYILPKDDEELNRLDFQHYLFRFALKGNYAAPLDSPTSILDVGTGTGRWAMEMAALFPMASVIGLDVVPPPADDTASLGHGLDRRPDNYVYVQGNVLDGLPFPDGTFDYVHQRLLTAAVPADRWPWLVTELVRVTKPGGWVELLEAIPTHGGPAMNKLYDWFLATGLSRGINMNTSPQIGNFLRNAGVQNVVERELPMALGSWGGRAGSMMETNYVALKRGALALMVQLQLTTPEEFDATMRAAREEMARGRYTWPYFIFYGQRPL